uniref:RING-type E3 ubiquitin transferase n=1 Tax=Chaetomium globosum (strain ATCC 6205 / CBS 148.51 / DSM 1962 / NBRC 6347 / NRRL 1970) TaxID=306901 RepID=Q2HDF0_CHAGB|nr:uncharacterized protein CHGG_01754 [Chaetomium globosum CBS 148.51]EAQ93519.1 hypothetical protein CHGG_01754 [Chaetomium globosum CBS 148.51]
MSDNVNVNPSWKGASTVSSTVIRNITALSSQMAYSARFAGNTTTLSTRLAPVANGVVAGLLFVPDLSFGDSCILETASHVPLSVVRQANLPPMNYHLVAIAPWVNGRCAEAFLDAARAAPVRAFLFYKPGTGSGAPPSTDSTEWHIDGGHSWMTRTNWPVYAVSGMVGEVMMQHLSLYSGNVTEVPFGRNISERYLADPEDYLRIWTELDLSTPPSGLETWAYVLIIIGVLLTVITSTSILMHGVQAWRRVGLRRRVVAGEVNLEAMGIKHLTVPQSHIKKFPLFTYHYEPDTASPPSSPRPPRITRVRTRSGGTDLAEGIAASRAAQSATVSDFGMSSPFTASTTATDYQPNCEICLERYENRVTVIRELPCGHIFHPECIDQFLHEISSLCPICKASMLPEGYCPKVTNDMVRRERAISRLRGHVEVLDDSEETVPAKRQGRWAATKSSFFGGRGVGMSSTSTELKETKSKPKPKKKKPPQPIRLQLRPPNSQAAADADDGADVNATTQIATTALARERMRELAGYEPDYGGPRITRWQRIRTRIFPGFS